jgi:hypothetical protein
MAADDHSPLDDTQSPLSIGATLDWIQTVANFHVLAGMSALARPAAWLTPKSGPTTCSEWPDYLLVYYADPEGARRALSFD